MAGTATPNTTTSPTSPTPLPKSFHIPLRPRQQTYLGTSNARRMLKRAQLAKASPENDPIFAMHEEAAIHDTLVAAASPFNNISISSNNYDTSATSTTSLGSNLSGPSSLGYSVHCYATHTEDTRRAKESLEAEKEMLVLLNSMNLARKAEFVSPLLPSALMCNQAQKHADSLYAEETSTIMGGTVGFLDSASTYIPHVTISTSRNGSRRATLVSPKGMGALACGEMWYGGKYRSHLHPVRSAVHLNLSDERRPSAESRSGSGSGSGSGSSSIKDDAMGGSSVVGEDGSGRRHHPEDCACRLRMVFETLVDGGWRYVGIGRGGEQGGGRWVVELGE